MQPHRPLSYDVGPYVVRQDAGGSKVYRVFSRSVALYHGTLDDCLGYAQTKYEDLALTLVTCTLCGARAGQRCTTSEGINHVARLDAYDRYRILSEA